ncbi:MAG TPA: TatD family hydrolase [Ohtaekwangia sp.]
MNFIDTHAHIYSDEFNADRADMLARCEEQGIGKIYMPNVDHTSIDGMMELENKDPKKYISTIGLHPCYVKKEFERELYLVEDWLRKRKFAAIGEIGTDLYWDKTFWEQQKEAFTIQINWAKQYNLPVIIHCRESLNETIEMMTSLSEGKVKGIFHCFTGSLEQAQQVIKLGFHLGIGGVATFKNGGLDKVLPEISMEHLVLETDSPYLAPVPHRGKRNEPAYIPLIAQRISDLKNISVDEVKLQTTQNALKLFNV